jgi:DNA-binding NarL/FixJ family response regulator
MSIRVVLADDHKVIRHALSETIKKENDMEVVGQAETGREVIKLAEELKPDVIIMDIAMPELNGIEATRKIIKNYPQIKIIVLSMHSNKRFIDEMFKAGAKRYLLKDCEYEELINAIRSVMTEQDPADSIKCA